jgi:hypothetical protein
MKAFPTHREEGMDLRDYFAAKAMQGMLANKGVTYNKNADENDKSGAERAYKIADVMMKAREIPNE